MPATLPIGTALNKAPDAENARPSLFSGFHPQRAQFQGNVLKWLDADDFLFLKQPDHRPAHLR